MAYQYSLDFGVFNALEAGLIPTGHVQVEFLRTDLATGGVTSIGLFEVMPTAVGNLGTFTNPFDGTMDGYMGVADLKYQGGIHTTVDLTESQANLAIDFIASHTGGPNNQAIVNYNTFGINGSSCYSFAQEFYSYVTGNQTSFLARFTEAELRSLSLGDPNWIIRWYGGVGPSISGESLGAIIAPCFAADTPILLADGTSIAIEDIRVGTRVAAFDERDAAGAGELRAGLVTRLIPGITTEWIALDDGTRVTPGHRYLRPDGSFMAIADIVASDGLVVAADGTVTRITGTLYRAADAGSDATWIEPYPVTNDNVQRHEVGNAA